MSHCILLSWLVLLSPAPGLPAETAANATRPPDRLYVSGRFDRLVSQSSGGGAGASWLRFIKPNQLFELGGYSNRMGSTSWQYGRTGIVVLAGRKSLTASLELGGGKEAGETFAYVTSRAGVGWAFVPGTVRGDIEAEYLNVNRTRGLMGKVGANVRAAPWLGLSFNFRHGLSGLDVDQVGARADIYARKLHFLGGVATGTFVSRELLVLGLHSESQTEWYGGVGLPLKENELTLVWSTLSSVSVTRHSVGATFQLRLGDDR